MQARFCIDTGTHNATIHSLLAAEDGKSLVSASRDGVIRVWDVEGRSEVRRILGKPLDGRSQWMEQISLVDQDQYVLAHTREVTGYNEGSSRLDVFHIPTGNLVRTITSDQLFSLMAVSDESRILALTTSQNHAVFLYNLDYLTQQGELSHLRTVPAPALPAAIAITRIQNDDFITFACSVDGQGQVVRARLDGGDAFITRLPGMRWPELLACSRSGTTAVCERYQNSIWLLDPQMKLLKKIEMEYHPTVLEFSPNGRLLVVGAMTASDDGRLEACRVYETGTWKAAGEYAGHDSPVTSLGFLGPERIVSAGGTSREIHFWNARTGETQGAITGKGNAARITGWEQDILGFCRAGGAGPVVPGVPAAGTRYFDLKSLKLLPQSASHQAPNASAGHMPEGLGIDYMGPYAVKNDWLATAGEDQTISLWYLPDVQNQAKTGFPVPALKMFISRDDDWIIWSQSGFYASSLNGDGLYGIHVQEKETQEGAFYPIDRFIKQLFRPAVIRAILEQGSEARALEHLKMDTVDVLPLLPPVVELISPRDGVTGDEQIGLRFEVRPARTAVDRIWVLKDDQFFWEKTGPEIAAGGFFETEVPLHPGENRLKILAESKSSKSIPVTLTINYQAQADAWDDAIFSFGGPPVMASAQPGKVDQSEILVQGISIDFGVKSGSPNQGRVELTRNGEKIWNSTETDHPESTPYHVEIPLAGDDDLVEIWDTTGDKRLVYTIQLNRAKRAAQPKSRGTTNEKTQAPPSQELPNLYLLAFGVSKLKHPQPALGFDHLDYAHEDANSITEKFKGQKSILYNDVITKTLINEKATRKNILDAATKLQAAISKRAEQKKLAKIATTDVVVVFLAGHGVEIDNEYYFWSHDMDIQSPKTTGISVVELGSIITALPGEVIFLVDTCRSGMIGRDFLRNLDPNVLAKLLISLNERAQYILTATERDTPSFEDAAYGHGYFTQGILDAFKQLPDVTALLLTDYVQERVLNLSGGDQVPVAQVYGEIYRRSIYRK